MLPRAHRLHRETEIQHLMKVGRTFFLPQLTVKYRFADLPQTKVTFVVSNRVSKRATERNLLKRRLRHAAITPLAQIGPGWLLAVIAKPTALTLTYRDLQQQLKIAFAKIKLTKANLSKRS